MQEFIIIPNKCQPIILNNTFLKLDSVTHWITNLHFFINSVSSVNLVSKYLYIFQAMDKLLNWIQPKIEPTENS